MKIIIIENSEFTRGILKSELEPGGFEILEAKTPDDALEILTTTPDIRLMTLSVILKGMDGFEFLEKLQQPEIQKKLEAQNNHTVQKVFVTTSDASADRLRGFKLGAADFIQKPWSNGQLLATLQRILTGGDSLSGLRVLVVDDSSSSRAIISTCLHELGVETTEATDGKEAFEILSKDHENIDLMITDLNMTVMDGDELCVKAREELGLTDLPIIFMSANNERDTILTLFKIGATDYLPKPFFKEELVARLRIQLERLKLTTTLQENVTQLEELGKVKDDFLAVCTHDLRSPLTGILGFAGLLRDDDRILPDQTEMVENIIKSGNCLQNLINNILDLKRTQSQTQDFEKTPQPVRDILQSTLDNLFHAAEPKGVSLQLENEAGNPAVAGNQDALSRVFSNLISNSIKFTPAEGTVTVKLFLPTPEQLTVEVTDTGVGIPADKIPHLFKSYTKKSTNGTDGEQGTGLGLKITSELVSAHGGTIVAESTEGEGSIFRIVFPLAAAEFSEIEPVEFTLEEVDMPSPEVSPQRILLVEDNQVNATLAIRLLESEGHQVAWANAGNVAVDEFESSLEENNPFQLVLMDIELPVINGMDATREIRDFENKLTANHPLYQQAVPIIAMTANAINEMPAEYEDAGMNDFLTKPFKQKELTGLTIKWCAVSVS